MEKSGYNHKLVFENIDKNPKIRKNRSRNITWFNPPFSLNVKTKIGKEFLKILDKSFPQNNPLCELFNRNTVKISYKCMPSMSQAISRHNGKVARQEQAQQQPVQRTCNCTVGNTCPVEGKCLTGPVLYRADITSNNNTEHYTGLTGNTFKDRYNKHASNLRHSNQRDSTTLSQHIWNLKDNNIDYTLKWNLVEEAPTFNHTTGKCRLCIREKWYIMFRPEQATLNDRTEFYSTCRHRKKNLLQMVKWNPEG